jgi:hypothetical protein
MTRALLAVLTVGAAMVLAGATRAQVQSPATSAAPASPASSTPAQPSAAPDAPSAAAAAPPPAAPAVPSPEVLRKAREGGFKPEVHKGVTVYCSKDDKPDTGTHFISAKKCYDEAQMMAILDRRQQDRDALNAMHQTNPSAK